MLATTYVKKRKSLLQQITKKFYEREKLNLEIKQIQKEMKAWDKALMGE